MTDKDTLPAQDAGPAAASDAGKTTARKTTAKTPRTPARKRTTRAKTAAAKPGAGEAELPAAQEQTSAQTEDPAPSPDTEGTVEVTAPDAKAPLNGQDEQDAQPASGNAEEQASEKGRKTAARTRSRSRKSTSSSRKGQRRSSSAAAAQAAADESGPVETLEEAASAFSGFLGFQTEPATDSVQMSLAGLIRQARAEAGFLPGDTDTDAAWLTEAAAPPAGTGTADTAFAQKAAEPATVEPTADSEAARDTADEDSSAQPETQGEGLADTQSDSHEKSLPDTAGAGAEDQPEDAARDVQEDTAEPRAGTADGGAQSPAEAFVSMLHKPAARPHSRWSTWSGWDDDDEKEPGRTAADTAAESAATATVVVSPAPSWLRESDEMAGRDGGNTWNEDNFAAQPDEEPETALADEPAASAGEDGGADTSLTDGEAFPDDESADTGAAASFWEQDAGADADAPARSWLEEEQEDEQDAEDFFVRTAVEDTDADDGDAPDADDADDTVEDVAEDGDDTPDADDAADAEDAGDDSAADETLSDESEESVAADEAAEEVESDSSEATGEGAAAAGEGSQSSRRRRRGRRGGRNHRRAAATPAAETETAAETPAQPEREAEEPEVRPEPAVRHNKRRMYISVLPGEQVEVAITSNGILDEYYLDMLHQKKLKGNIYRGIIVNIDINLQAAFVDFGAEKNGFLQIDEIHPEYYTSTQEYVRGKKYPPIQKVLRLGQEVLVQVVKEPNGTKGAFLTTWISLAGRFLVLTPGQEQIGISRKVHDEGERNRLRELMNGIDPGDDLGVIVRTVSAGVTQATLKNDLAYLKRTWNEVRRHATGVIAPACVYREPGLPERAVRDYLTDDVCEIWVDNADIAGRIRDTVAMLFPQKKDLVRVHNDPRHSLWERFNLRRQLDQIYSREVLMPSGGRLVFDQTEALMAIDINSGKISCKGNFENMAFKTNMEAAETIARQLKLRDIGGQVVIDFIEMREHKHVVEVERTLRNAMKNDKARHDVSRMSSFGLLELVRQRTGTSAISISMEPCPACGGTGLRRNLEWQSLQALRDIARIMRSRATSPCRYEMTQELGLYVLNHKRDSLRELEKQYGKNIEIIIRP